MECLDWPKKPDRHVSPLSPSRGDGDAWRQLGASWLSMGGANSSFRSDPGPWVPRVVSAPPQDEKCPHLLKVATSRILWAKSLAERGALVCRIALGPSRYLRATKPRCKGVKVPRPTLLCQPKHVDSVSRCCSC